MNERQMKAISRFEEYISEEVKRLSTGRGRYRPDAIIFQKIAKKLLTWVQNAIPRKSIDESKEVQDLLEYLTHIVVSPFALTKIFEITYNYKMVNCQLILVKGLFTQADFKMIDREMVNASLGINQGHLLPETRMVVELLK